MRKRTAIAFVALLAGIGLAVAQVTTNPAVTGVGVQSNVVVTGGTINGTTIGASTPSSGAFTTISATGQITSSLATGTAPLSIASTTQVANLNAATAGTATNQSGGTVAATTGTFSTSAKALTAMIGDAATFTNDLTINRAAGSETTLGDGLRITRMTVGDNAVPYMVINVTSGIPRIIVNATATTHGVFKLQSWDGTTLVDRVAMNNTGMFQWASYASAGTMSTDASGNITTASDERLKKDVRPFERGLDAVMHLSPILHGYTAESGLDQTKNDYAGFSAQNVKAAIPETVGKMSDGTLTLSDRGIIAALVNAVKEQQKTIDKLQTKITAIELSTRTAANDAHYRRVAQAR